MEASVRRLLLMIPKETLMAQEKNPQQVRDVMTANPQTVTEKDSVLQVARIMRDKDTGVVPVVDGRKIIGLVTDRDIVVRCVADGKEIKNCSVKDVMTRKVKTVNEDATLRDVLNVMSTAESPSAAKTSASESDCTSWSTP